MGFEPTITYSEKNAQPFSQTGQSKTFGHSKPFIQPFIYYSFNNSAIHLVTLKTYVILQKHTVICT